MTTNQMPSRAMVLAAGLGTRMRPLTDTMPKPLIPVAGKPLIDHVLDRFAAAGVEQVVVNAHHHRDKLEAHLHQRTDLNIHISVEPELLETGGGVVRALPLLGPDPFFVANSDNLWLDGATPALTRLAQAWRDADMDVLLLLQRSVGARGYEGMGDFLMDQLGRLRRRKSYEVAPFVFSGVQIIHPRALKDAPSGAFSLNLIYDRAESRGRLYGIAHDGLWFHVGTPESIAETEAELGYVKRAPSSAT